MKERGLLLTMACILCWGKLSLPMVCLAGWRTDSSAAAQPVLVTALILTSLVLFLIYVFLRRQAPSQTTLCSGLLPGKQRCRETDQALEYFFSRQILPMAKLGLDHTRILDATPSLYEALGYSKPRFLSKSGQALGICPSRAGQQLELRGWNEFETRLFNRQSGNWESCRILLINCRFLEPPCTLAIVSGLSGKIPTQPLPGFISDLLDKRTIIQ